jgi:hypothetical protein
MAAKVEDIIIEQGATFRRLLTIRDSLGVLIDIADWAFRGQIRTSATSVDVIADFTFTDGAGTGEKNIELDALTTEAIVTTGEKYSAFTKLWYDVEAELLDGTVYRLLNGLVQVSPEITRDV